MPVQAMRWARLSDEPFEYAVQDGPHGDEFVRLLDGSCLRREIPQAGALEISAATLKAGVDMICEEYGICGPDIGVPLATDVFVAMCEARRLNDDC